MRRLKIGIRPQLIILVGFSSLFSLLILAIVTGVYFSLNLSNLRSERLVIISELLALQVEQWLDYTYYQVSGLTQKEAIYSPLSSYRAGNNSNIIFANAQNTLDQFISSSDLFASARLYNLDLAVVADSNNSEVNISAPVKSFLYPLAQNASVPPQLQNTSANNQRSAYITGPIANSSDPNAPFFMGMTLPIYANSSIIINDPSLSGYLTILINATSIQQALNDTTSTSNTPNGDFSVIIVQPIFGSTTDGVDNLGTPATRNSSDIIAFKAIFVTQSASLNPNQIYNINSSTAIREAILQTNYELTGGDVNNVTTDGTATNVRDINNELVAIGFYSILIDSLTDWTLIIEQPRSNFLEPVNQFTRIIIGVVVGIGAFMCLITFPLAWYFVKPITTLKEATEAITGSKKKKKPEKEDIPPPYFALRESRDNEKLKKKDERNLVNSMTSGHSTAIRLPKQLHHSKKFFKDELTELTDAFNIMTEELDKQYTHLEDRVKLRTKELEVSKLEAEAANEAKTVFIANISHELRTPLNGILGMTAIAMDEPDNSRIQDSLKLINRSGELLLHILTELLTYSKNTLKRSKLEKSNFQILEVVYQVKSIFSKLALDSKINFTVFLKPDILRKLILYGDSNRIIQIVMNLVSNSMKFTPVDGSVDVTFKLLGEYDYNRSARTNFTKVHVLRNLNRPLPATPSSPSKASDIRNPFVSQKPTEIKKTNTASNDVNDLDNVSLTTISTAEYDNNLFRSQFNYHKPLPHRPGSINGEELDQGNTNKNIGNILIDKNNTDSSMTMNSIDPLKKEQKGSDSDNSFKVNDNTVYSNSSNEKAHPLVLPPKQANPHHHVNYQPRKTSLSSMSKQEIVKNGKVHRIRRLYKPKTWVLQVQVKDTGPGIEPALQEKVFEPFIQGDQTLSRSYGGTGLGLSICRQLATMMNGTLTLKSAIGVGSTFTFTVPLQQKGEILVSNEDLEDFCNDEFNMKAEPHIQEVPDNDVNDKQPKEEEEVNNKEKETVQENIIPEVSEDDSTPKIEITSPSKEVTKTKLKHSLNLEMPSKANLFEKPHLITRSSTGTANSSNGSDGHHDIIDDLQHLRILVAEDNLVNQEVIKRMLKLEGFENITMAANGADAVEYVKESYEKLELFDLIFMDVQMPKIDGLLATKMIRNNLQFRKPIIALTAFADESNVKECLNAGMSGFLSKPIRRTNLRQVIVEFSPILLSDIVTTPQGYLNDDKRLDFPITPNIRNATLTSPNTKVSPIDTKQPLASKSQSSFVKFDSTPSSSGSPGSNNAKPEN